MPLHVSSTMGHKILYEQLATLLASQVPFAEAVETILEEKSAPRIQRQLGALQQELAQGSTPAQAVERRPQLFPPLVGRLLADDSQPEKLAQLFSGLAEESQQSMTLQNRTKAVFSYPAIILALCLVIASIIIIFVLPVLAAMFGDFGQQLPRPTAFVLYLAGDGQPLVVLLVALLAGSLLLLHQRPQLGHYIPLLAPLLRRLTILSFFRYLRLMLSLEMPAQQAVQESAQLLGQSPLARRLHQLAQGNKSGMTLSAWLAGSQLFSPLALQMIKVGEKSAQLPQSLQRLTVYQQEELQRATSRFAAIAALLAWLLAAGLIGSFITAVYLPLFQMGSLL